MQRIQTYKQECKWKVNLIRIWFFLVYMNNFPEWLKTKYWMNAKGFYQMKPNIIQLWKFALKFKKFAV